MNHCTYNTDCAGCVTYGAPLLSVEGVNLSYGDKTILRDVNVQIMDVNRRCHIQGQVVGFLGPSGVGKTQLFRIIAGLNRPTSGQVLINSTRDPVKAGMVGVVSQSYTLFEHRTVLGNLMLGAVKKEHDHKIARDKALDLLSKFGLADKANSYPATLSGGQRQRVAIAQQLACSEHFILLDEPFSGLDPVNTDKVCSMLTEVACMDSLNTVIVISHDVSAVCSIADHLWLIGRETGKPGATIKKVYDLVSMGLCWQENIQTRPDFAEFVRQIKTEFINL